jgi:DeoR family transcriptional regulator, suf operon transcriptional repressor
MHDTKQLVLEHIRAQGFTTVASLAEALGVSIISIRHHLNGLMAEGLIKVELERQHVGRPKHVYSLTEAAQRYFPNKYHVLVEQLLDTLKATLSTEQVEAFLDRMASDMAAKYGAAPIEGTLEQRLVHLVNILGEEGFMAEVRHIDDKTILTALNCPYIYIGQRHPEVCRIDHTIIKSVLGVPVQQTSCVLHGDKSCTFSVSAD